MTLLPKMIAAAGIAVLCLTYSMYSAATTITVGSASALTGSLQCQAPYSPAQCNYQGYDTTGNLAYSGGAASPAIVSSTLGGNTPIHQPGFANDGFYGNGRSWIAGSSNAWLKIDLGSVQAIDQITFGRDRLGGFDDRDPGQFTIDVASVDAIFLAGNADSDGSEYTQIVDSLALGFSGSISGSNTVSVNLDAGISARFIKLTFANNGTAIDEIEVFGVPAPGTSIFIAMGLLGAFFRNRQTSALTSS